MGLLLQRRWLQAFIEFIVFMPLWMIWLVWIIHIWSTIDAALFKSPYD